jgi:DNA-binding CsgD family transcriptional regulator
MKLPSEAMTAARAGESHLTERQREILALVVRGHTNGEIAEETGLSLATVKWHMSEILSKLGLTSRDEAAEYWQARQRPAERVTRWAKGLMGVPALKFVGAASALATAAAIGFTLLFSGGETKSGDITNGYYLVINEKVIRADGSVRESVRRVWYADSIHYRSEFIDENGERTDFEVADGDKRWLYNQHDNRFWDTPLFPVPPGGAPPMLGGEKIGVSGAQSMAALLEALPERAPEHSPYFNSTLVSRFAKVVGHDRVLGRDVTIIEFGPAWTDQREGVTTFHGTARVWVDDETLMFMKFETDDGPESERVVRAGVMELKFGRPDDSVFRFDPPKGATALAPAPFQAPPQDAIHQLVKPGWYHASAVPAGFFPIEAGANGRPDNFTRQDVFLVDTTTVPASNAALVRSIRLKQEKVATPAPPSTGGDQVLLRSGITAELSTEGSDLVLTFGDGDVSLRLAGRNVTREELIAFANSLEKHP